MSKRSLYYLGLLTLFGFGGIGLIAVQIFVEGGAAELFNRGWPIHYQLLAGLVFAIPATVLANAVINLEVLRPTREHYSRMFRNLRLRWWEVLFISFCAGLGEELFFRAGIQNWLGVWLTSILFISLHGYLNPFDWRISIYGFFMVFLSSGLGYLFEYSGLWAAAFAHFLIDVFLLWEVRVRDGENYPDDQDTFSDEDQRETEVLE